MGGKASLRAACKGGGGEPRGEKELPPLGSGSGGCKWGTRLEHKEEGSAVMTPRRLARVSSVAHGAN